MRPDTPSIRQQYKGVRNLQMLGRVARTIGDLVQTRSPSKCPRLGGNASAFQVNNQAEVPWETWWFNDRPKSINEQSRLIEQSASICISSGWESVIPVLGKHGSQPVGANRPRERVSER